jgi:hypothetical protein
MLLVCLEYAWKNYSETYLLIFIPIIIIYYAKGKVGEKM